MRNICLVLVLANLGFAAWAAWYAQPRAETARVVEPDVPRITLVSELEGAAREALASLSEDAPEPVATTAPASAAAGPQGCTSVGPFEELAQASSAQAALRAAGYAPSQRVVDGEVWVGYWVHLPGIPTREAAAEILERLRANDIADSYIVPGGQESHTISLGVFSEISRAGTVREQVRALGYDPTVADRSRRATLYWIDVTATDGAEIDLDMLQAPGRINRLEQRPCASVG